jgi:hypothetical protein
MAIARVTPTGFLIEQGNVARVTPTGFLIESVSSSSLALYYPASDISLGSWTPSAGGTLFGVIDEVTADDADYAVSGSGSADTMEIKFGGVLSPSADTGHVVSYRIKADAAVNMTVALYCGATLIKSWSHSPAPTSFTPYDQPLSTVEADSITNYADLRLRVTKV